MLVHHSLKDPNRGASGRASTGASIQRNESVRTENGGRSSPLKFFASSTRQQQQQAAQRQASPERPAAEPVTEPHHAQKPGAAHKRWTVDYLTDLRKPVGARPMGARPPPARNAVASFDLPVRAASALGSPVKESRQDPIEKLKRSISPFASQRSQSALGNRKDAGRPLARGPDPTIMEDIAATNAQRDQVVVEIDGQKAPMPYYERGQRWMEKQEAKSLRAAMEYMDLEKEKEVHEAAQEEAADLVWKHKYSGKPYENPEVFKKTLKEHLKEGSHARSQSIGPFSELYVTKGGATEGKRSASDSSSSNASNSSNRATSGNRVVSTSSKESGSTVSSSGSRRYGSLRNSAGRLFGSMRSAKRRSRQSSGGNQSSTFSNPGDRIFEEPEAIIETSQEKDSDLQSKGPLKPTTRNTSGSYKSMDPKNDFLAKNSFLSENKVSSIDIHKNPPSKSRDAKYKRNSINAVSDATTRESESTPPTKNGIEIRSDDIRAATSRRLKDRSENLPTPTYVSDTPGRPIVSFQSGYKPKDSGKSSNARPNSREGLLAGARPMPGKPQMPATTVSAPIVPRIETPDSTATSRVQSHPPIPQISLPEEFSSSQPSENIPTIDFQDSPSITIAPPADIPAINVLDSSQPSVPTINIGGPDQLASQNQTRPAPLHTNSAPPSNPVRSLRGHWSPAVPRINANAAACCTCGLPIQGRTLSAAGQRFHPACFNCFQCRTNLEHVAFYPEPDAAKEERFGTEGADSFARDLDQRFFCHLDFHELFSPRCKSCKTPIEGEVVLACGAQWHQGHFFCAQCGDPFDGTIPFIEKEGWAWCVGCYKGRFSGKCRGCKKPVVEGGVKALGAEWHEQCFVCTECNGPFEEGKFFTRGAGEGVVCVACEERRLKA